VGADATEASAANPGSEVLTDTEPGKLSRKSNFPMLFRSGSAGENGLVISEPVGGLVETSDGESKRTRSGVCVDEAGLRAGSMGDAR
jgi:hypothetical protein